MQYTALNEDVYTHSDVLATLFPQKVGNKYDTAPAASSCRMHNHAFK